MLQKKMKQHDDTSSGKPDEHIYESDSDSEEEHQTNKISKKMLEMYDYDGEIIQGDALKRKKLQLCHDVIKKFRQELKLRVFNQRYDPNLLKNRMELV